MQKPHSSSVVEGSPSQAGQGPGELPGSEAGDGLEPVASTKKVQTRSSADLWRRVWLSEALESSDVLAFGVFPFVLEVFSQFYQEKHHI